MTNINIATSSNNIVSMLEQTIKFNEPLTVSTDIGNAIILSEDDYRSLIETLYLTSIPEMEEKLLAGKATPLSDCVPESEVDL